MAARGGHGKELALIRAPFPWFGGKSRVAPLVWDRFGDVPNYVEPFAGSLAVLLGRPTEPRIETVNDLDSYLANFWRALQADPEEVARWADWPVNETDLHARHRWLVGREEFRERMRADPEYHDARIAGWWVWGISQWIGSGWCSMPQWEGRVGFGAPRGIHTVHQTRPSGIHASGKRPHLWRGGVGVVGKLHAKMPKMDRGTTSRMAAPRATLIEWFEALAARLRYVRVCCGDWKRILGPSPTVLIGTTAVFLDPPYDPVAIAGGSNKVDGHAPSDALYSHHGAEASREVREWAIEHGDDPQLRIALCGYEGEHAMPASWSVEEWTAQGGYSVRAKANGRRNRERERIWFSPNCLGRRIAGPLFAAAEVSR